MLITKDTYLFNKFFKTTTIATFFYIAVYTYLFMLTPYLDSIGWSDTLKGIFFGIFSAVGIFAAPVVGTLSDKLGRFNLIIAGLVLEIIALAGYIYMRSPALILTFRVLGAIAFNAIVISSISRVNDVSTNTNRAKNTGIFQSFVSIAAITAPLLGGFVADQYGYIAVFQVAQIIMISMLISLAIYDKVLFKKQNYKKNNRVHKKLTLKDLNPVHNVQTLLKIKDLRMISLFAMMMNFALPAFVLVIPFITINVLHFSNTQLSLLMLFRGLAHLFQFEMGIITEKVGLGKSIIASIIIFIIGFTGLFFAKTFIAFATILLIQGLGAALWNVSATTYISDIAERKNIEGKVMGSYNSLSRISSTLSYTISGIALTLWSQHIMLLYAGIALLGLAIFGPRIYTAAVNLEKTS